MLVGNIGAIGRHERVQLVAEGGSARDARHKGTACGGIAIPTTRAARVARRSRALCYISSMKRQRRAGATETFSVSVDPETKNALRALADSAYGGNLSALVTELAEDARRRLAAGAFLKRNKLRGATAEEAASIEAELEREVAAWTKRRKGRRVA